MKRLQREREKNENRQQIDKKGNVMVDEHGNRNEKLMSEWIPKSDIKEGFAAEVRSFSKWVFRSLLNLTLKCCLCCPH